MNIEKAHERIIKQSDSCWIWIGAKTPKGYGHLAHQGKHILAHRFFYEHYKGQIPAGCIVRHTCDVTSCVNPEHLLAGSYEDNIQDQRDHGRRLGRKRTISDEVHFDIERRLHLGESYLSVGRLHNVSPGYVWKIRNRLANRE